MESISAGGDRAKNGRDADDARLVSATAIAIESAAAAVIDWPPPQPPQMRSP